MSEKGVHIIIYVINFSKNYHVLAYTDVLEHLIHQRQSFHLIFLSHALRLI